jgi:hypothetical protein
MVVCTHEGEVEHFRQRECLDRVTEDSEYCPRWVH